MLVNTVQGAVLGEFHQREIAGTTVVAECCMKDYADLYVHYGHNPDLVERC